MNISPAVFDSLFKITHLTVIIPTLLVIISAIVSAKELGGTLGQGLKKIAIGTIVDTTLIATYFLLEKGYQGVLTDEQIKILFLFSGFFASVFLILGYIQVYRVSKKLKLFTI